MARYRSARSGDRRRSRTYMVLVLIVFVAVITFIYTSGPFGPSGERPPAGPNDVNNPVAVSVQSIETHQSPPLVPVEPNTPLIVEEQPAEDNEPAVQQNPEAEQLIAKAMELLGSDKQAGLIAARDLLNQALALPMSPQQRQFVKDQLTALAEKWLFSRTVYPGDKFTGTYKVQPGDLLSSIARRYKVPYELLMRINNISKPQLLRAGETIKIVHGPFHAKVYRSTFTMDVFLQDLYVRSFPVGLGQEGMETPTGLWAVKADGKLIEPPWPDPVTGKILHAGDPGYALGSRWIGLDGLEGAAKGRTGFGIHGTKDPESIGKRSSRGCIRLYNGDVILLYDMLVPVHSLVTVED